MTETSKSVCYVHEAQEGFAPPLGYQTRPVGEKDKLRAKTWFRRRPSVQWLIVYRDQCQLSLDNLEVVSFVHGELATGYMCSCDLAIKLTQPELLVADIGSDEGVVADKDLDDRLRPRVTVILKDVGGGRDLEKKTAWPEVYKEVSERLKLPGGTCLEAFGLREVRRFEKCIQEVIFSEGFKTEIEKARLDGALARAIAEQRLDKLLVELGEERAASLLTQPERQQPAMERLAKYMEMFGLRWSDLVSQLTDLHRIGIETQKTSVQTQRNVARILKRLVAIQKRQHVSSAPIAPQTAKEPGSADAFELAAVLDELEQLQLKELAETLNELESLQAVQGRE